MLALLQVLGRWPGVNFQVVQNIVIILIIKITLIMIILIIKITLIMIIIIGCEQQRADQLHKHMIIIMNIIITMIMIIMITGCKQQRADQLHKHPVWEADRSHLGSFPRPRDRSGPVETEKKTDDGYKIQRKPR